MSSVGVKEIWQVDDRTLGITWTDQKEQHFDVVELRRQCPCAHCKDEMTGAQKEFTVQETLRPKHIASNGRHALTIEFDDGHKTGIYLFEKLRNLPSS
ncbi:MAG: DUF971 domain-containing protein [Oligoflexales bacterium]